MVLLPRVCTITRMTGAGDRVKHKSSHEFDPEAYRMSLGDHLEELRRRLILGLMGFVVALVVCLIFGQRVTAAFCAPLIRALQQAELNPQIYYTDVADGFMVFLKISIISAVAIASPWLLYQLWLFVAAGLYPHERRWVKRYMPLSIFLLITGMVFVYFLVLPWTLGFFIEFGSNLPLPAAFDPKAALVEEAGTPIVALHGDPRILDPEQPMIWFNIDQNRLKVFTGVDVRVIPFGPSNLAAPIITLPNYISLVFAMLLIFGLSFQLPLGVLVLVRVGIVQIDALRAARRYVYFAMVIAASVITPGDVITVTIALIGPLILLYEFGIWLSVMSGKRRDS